MSISTVQVLPQATDDKVEYVQSPMAKQMETTATGVQLMDGETQLWTGYMHPKLKTKGCCEMWCFGLFSACQALCECYKPRGKKRMDIVVTNKRIVIRHYEAAQYPGAKTCCFWVSCMMAPCCCIQNLCCAVQTTVVKETEDVFYTSDLRNVRFDFGARVVAKDGCCDTPDLVSENDTKGLPFWSEIVLEFAKPVGVTKSKSETSGNIGSWKVDKQLATYVAKINLEGYMIDTQLRDLQYVLKRVLHDNLTAGKPSVEATLQVPTTVNMSLGNGGESIAEKLS